jgi:riboflavin synthase
MFTGIIEAVVQVVSFDGRRLTVSQPKNETDWSLGESIAIDGCCLTLVDASDELSFELSEETLERTTLADLQAGTWVNFERALRVGDRFGGHFVQGHVDGVGVVAGIEQHEQSWTFTFEAPDGSEKLLVDKGSIAIDGISLTIVAPHGLSFSVAVIPHTFENTTLRHLKPGDRVNVEFDMIAKHVARMIKS